MTSKVIEGHIWGFLFLIRYIFRFRFGLQMYAKIMKTLIFNEMNYTPKRH